MTSRLRPPPAIPEGGVRARVVTALILPGDDFAEAALNATEEERRFAAEMSGWLAELYGIQAATLGDIAKALAPYWRAPGATLMDAMAEAPDDVRARCLRYLTLAGLLPDG